MNYFSLSELCITNDPIPQDVADKLLQHHIAPMNLVRKGLGVPVTASMRSGYRPREYERQKGRSGNSQHTFQGKGAVDWMVVHPDKLYFWTMVDMICYKTPYTRICVYPNNGFVHCDYAADSRELFECESPTSAWVRTDAKHWPIDYPR